VQGKFVIIIHVILLGLLISAFGIPQVKSSQALATTGWSQTYGGTGEEQAFFVNQTADGGYALAGITDSFGAGNYDFWLVKTDESGNMQWNYTYGGTNNEMAYCALVAHDGGYALTGYTRSFGAGGPDVWLVKTDISGSMEWNKTYGGTQDDYAYSIIQTDDGGYALVGKTKSYGMGDENFWLIKTNSSGDVEWSKAYGGLADDDARSVIQTSDGGYALAGTTYVSWGQSNDFWLVKTDSSGNMEWNMTYGGEQYDYALSVVQTADDGYALAGHTESFGAGNVNFWLIKTDSSGNHLWNKTYGGTQYNYLTSLIQTSDGGYALGGYTDCFGAGAHDFWLVKTNSSGNAQWNMTYGGTLAEYALSMIQTSDGGYALAGCTGSFGSGESDFWLVKTDESGVIPEFSSPFALLPLLATFTLFAVTFAKKKFQIKPKYGRT
jgi:hypothetical protein